MFEIVPGATVLIPSGPAHDPQRRHLFVILANPVAVDLQTQDLQVPVVSISKIIDGQPYDGTCVLYRGDHPFIVQASYVYYAMAFCILTAKLTQRIHAEECIPCAKLIPEVFERVLTGVLESPHSKPRIRGLCR
jgi:hypothetical protein